jgi:hypothetical protein
MLKIVNPGKRKTREIRKLNSGRKESIPRTKKKNWKKKRSQISGRSFPKVIFQKKMGITKFLMFFFFKGTVTRIRNF